MANSPGTARTSYALGPWEYRLQDERTAIEILDEGGQAIAQVAATSKGDFQATARLIAASPELLEALRVLLRYAEAEAQESLDDGDTEAYNGCQQDIGQARTAIRKATGESV